MDNLNVYQIITVYLAIGAIYSYYKLCKLQDEKYIKKITDRLNEKMSGMFVDMAKDIVNNNKILMFCSLVLLWPLNLYYALKRKIFNKKREG